MIIGTKASSEQFLRAANVSIFQQLFSQLDVGVMMQCLVSLGFDCIARFFLHVSLLVACKGSSFLFLVVPRSAHTWYPCFFEGCFSL